MQVDASDFFRLSRAMDNLPTAIKYRVINRSLHRMQTMGKTRVVRLAAQRVSLAQKHIRPNVKTPFGKGLSKREIVVRTSWIPLGKLGPRQTRRGVTVPKRGSFRSAFIATMSSGHTGVFKRKTTRSTPIFELHGPNPANDIATSPDPYQDLLSELIRDDLGNRMIHELSRALPN